VSGGRQTRENALVSEEQRAGADRHEGPLVGRVALLQLRVGRDEVEGLGLILNDRLDIAADHHHDVEVREALVGLFERDLGADDDALVADDLGFAGGDGHLEGFGGCAGRA
jgi:hypothetical protein